MIYFTSDLHLGHRNIIKLAQRGFDSIEQMDEQLIKNFNNRVTDKDTVYILGDITMKGAEYANIVIPQLNGTKVLVQGNHDRFCEQSSFNKSLFEEIVPYKELKYDGLFIVMCHYPFVEWNGSYRGSLHLHGHIHSRRGYNRLNKENKILKYDVGVDASNYQPISIEEVLKFFKL